MSSVSSHNGYFRFWFYTYAVRVWLIKSAAFRKWASVTGVTVRIKQGAIMCVWSGSVGAEFDNMKGLNSVCQCVILWYIPELLRYSPVTSQERLKPFVIPVFVVAPAAIDRTALLVCEARCILYVCSHGTLVDRLQGRVNSLCLN
jgi:hypothetical protein